MTKQEAIKKARSQQRKAKQLQRKLEREQEQRINKILFHELYSRGN